jgi:hypothetical protein
MANSSNTDYLNHITSLNSSVVPSPPSLHTSAIADTGCTGHYISISCPHSDRKPSRPSLAVRVPNGAVLHSSHTLLACRLPSPHLSRARLPPPPFDWPTLRRRLPPPAQVRFAIPLITAEHTPPLLRVPTPKPPLPRVPTTATYHSQTGNPGRRRRQTRKSPATATLVPATHTTPAIHRPRHCQRRR